MGHFNPIAGRRQEMPVAFGPVDLDRIQYKDVTRVSVSYLTTHDAIAALIPPGLVPADEPLVTVSYQKVREVSFLAGRGYNILAVDLAVSYERASGEKLAGSYPPIVWEDDVYSIIVGREPFGVAKIFGDIPSTDPIGSQWQFECREFGSLLVSGQLSELQEVPQDQLAGLMPPLEEPAVVPATFRWKHIPSAGGGTSAGFLMKGNQMSLNSIKQAWTGSGSVEFSAPSWEQAPVAHRYMSDLQGLRVVEPRPSTAMRGVVDIHQWTGRPLPTDGSTAFPSYLDREESTAEA